MNEEKVYTKEEVQQLIEPLMKQIEYYQSQYILCRQYIIDEPWYKFIFSKFNFLIQTFKQDDESDTLIENLRLYADKNPTMFEFLKEFYDKKNPKNN